MQVLAIGLWFFVLEAGLLIAVTAVGALVLFASGSGRRDRRRVAFRVTGVFAAMLTVAMAFSIQDTAVHLRNLDFWLGFRERSQLMHARVDTRQAIPLGNGGYFFVRTTGFSPDPYCGYEYAPTLAMLVLDPLGSGQGNAEPLGVDGWYWICAS